jgi:protein-S-isoprenylcysteine O-methyltransferase Ste14
MVEQFGTAYHTYMASTGRFLPKLPIRIRPGHQR